MKIYLECDSAAALDEKVRALRAAGMHFNAATAMVIANMAGTGAVTSPGYQFKCCTRSLC